MAESQAAPSSVLYLIAAPTSQQQREFFSLVWTCGKAKITDEALQHARMAAKLREEQRTTVSNNPRLCSIVLQPPLAESQAVPFACELATRLGGVSVVRMIRMGNTTQALGEVLLELPARDSLSDEV